jgi:hypothetical protein
MEFGSESIRFGAFFVGRLLLLQFLVKLMWFLFSGSILEEQVNMKYYEFGSFSFSFSHIG